MAFEAPLLDRAVAARLNYNPITQTRLSNDFIWIYSPTRHWHFYSHSNLIRTEWKYFERVRAGGLDMLGVLFQKNPPRFVSAAKWFM